MTTEQIAAPAQNGIEGLSTLNSQQASAAYQPDSQAVQVVAGAGTGKTELIAHRFIHLVKTFQEKGITQSQNRIAVVTFTNEASLSMRARIDRYLSKTVGLSLDGQCWISNFHQLANRILRQHALHLNLSPQFEILDSLGQHILFERMIENIINGDYNIPSFQKMLARIFKQYGLEDIPGHVFTKDYLQQTLGISKLLEVLNPTSLLGVIQQAKASGLSPSQFYATAKQQIDAYGTALSTLPVREIFENTERNDKGKPLPIPLMLSYIAGWKKHLSPWTDKHWQPIEAVDSECLDSGEEPSSTLYKKAVDDLISTLCQYDRSAKAYIPKGDLDDVIRRIQSDQQSFHSLVIVVSAVYALYQHSLRVKNVCDFDDLINHCLTLFEKHPEIAEYYRSLFLHVIVDEFQDSNTSQLRLLQFLTKPGQSNLTVVGDQKQSIYSFRFAQPDNLHLVFDNPDQCQQIPLNTNYRSYPPILSVANVLSDAIVRNASQRLNACERYAENTEPFVTWCTFGVPEETVDSKGNPKLKEEAISSQQEREAEWIASEIEQLVQSHVQNPEQKTLNFNEIAILVKSHSKAELIQQALNGKNIPSVRKKNLGFFEDGSIKTALALLHLMVNLHDDTALVRVVQTKLNHRELYLLAQAREQLTQQKKEQVKEAKQTEANPKDKHTKSKMSLFDVIFRLKAMPELAPALPTQTREALTSLGQSLLNLKKRQSFLTPSQLLKALANEVGIIQPETAPHLKHQQRVNIRTLEKWLLQIASSNTIQPTLREILETIAHYQQNSSLDIPISNGTELENAVQIMTVHASKGLEFSAVFVAWCEKPKTLPQTGPIAFDPQNAAKSGFGLFTGKSLVKGSAEKSDTLHKMVYQTIWQRPQVDEEEQRLFYVALTRAQKKLYVLHSRQSPSWTKPPKLEQKTWLHHWVEADNQE